MKAKTQSRISGTIAPTVVRVSSTATSPAQPGSPAFSTIRQAIQQASSSPNRAKALLRPSSALSATRSKPMSARPGARAARRCLAVRPVAEGQDRHDNERADHRQEVQERPGAGEAGARADAPGRDDEGERQHEVKGRDDKDQDPADAEQPEEPVKDEIRQGPRPRSRSGRRAAG